MSLMERIQQHAADGMPNAEAILRDQFVEQALDGAEAAGMVAAHALADGYQGRGSEVGV